MYYRISHSMSCKLCYKDSKCHCPNQLNKLTLFLFFIYLDCTAPFVVKFSATILAADTKAAPTDQPQRGILFSLCPNVSSDQFTFVPIVTTLY